MKYTGVGSVRDYILRMLDLHTKINALGSVIAKDVLVHQALNTLPSKFGILKTNFNSQDENWSINDLISRAVSEEEKLRKDTGNLALVASSSTNKKGK